MKSAGGARAARVWVPLRALLALAFWAAAGPGGPPAEGAAAGIPGGVSLTRAEVESVVAHGATALAGERFSLAVVDRTGRLLALWHRPGASAFEDELALSLARTGAFFSNDQAPLSSRTVRFISGIHFPPGVRNQPNGALYGIENTNRVDYHVAFNPGKAYPPPLNVDGTGPSLGIATGKRDIWDSDPHAVHPGGIPIFKHGRVAGGVGVAGVPPDQAEFAAYFASLGGTGFGPRPAAPGVIFIDGISLPFVHHTRRPPGALPGSFFEAGAGSYRVEPRDGEVAPDGWLAGPYGSPRLSAAEVVDVVTRSYHASLATRAAIRLPLGSRTRMVIAVGDLDGNILGLFRMPDSTIFSLDVAVAKARNVVYFSGPTRHPNELPGIPFGAAVTNRTLSFGSQPLYPAGIDGTISGPFFHLFAFDTANPGSQGLQPDNPNQNGIVFFPGSIPLYRNGQLIGGLGISGDGVDQDDFVAFHGGAAFPPPPHLRADNFPVRGVRIPFLKFPRNPTQ